MDQKEICDQCQFKCTDVLNEKFKKYVDVTCSLLEHLGLKKQDAIICGSMALYRQDMPVNDIHDVDLELRYSPGLEATLELLASANPSKVKCNYSTTDAKGYKRIDFMYRDVQFNVWMVPNLDERPYMWMNYLKYASIMSVLEYKFRYAREKDTQYYLRLDSIFKTWLLSKTK
jgi:hypothetical protein